MWRNGIGDRRKERQKTLGCLAVQPVTECEDERLVGRTWVHKGYTVHPGWLRGLSLRSLGCVAVSSATVHHRYEINDEQIVVLSRRRGVSLKIRGGWMFGLYFERNRRELRVPQPKTELFVAVSDDEAQDATK
jgi:hypothetical protein